MKVKLPEKAFFNLGDLAARWQVDSAEIIRLIEMGEIPMAEKYAAMHGKRKTFWAYYGFNRPKDKHPCWEASPPQHLVDEWKSRLRDDEHLVHYPIDCEFVVEPGRENAFEVFKEFEKRRAIDEEKSPALREHVILLSDVLDLEKKYATDDSTGAGSLLGNRERTTLLNIIGALLAYSNTKESAIIDSILDSHPEAPGLKKRTLEEKFAEAKRSLKAN